MSFPRTARALRDALESRGVRPRKRHGQNFLTDLQAVDAIVRDAGVTEADHVVEVGTGAGLLTHALCETGARITTFEIDEGLLAVARDLRDWPDRVRFVAADVLATKHELAPVFREAVRERPPGPGRTLLVSNLPYGAGTPIVLGLLALDRPPDLLVVMLQEEVVRKFVAGPGSADYGVPSIAVGLKAEGEVVRRFGPEVFWPRPKVRSAVIRLTPRERGLEADEHGPFGAFVTALFTRRRKMLRAALRHALPTLPEGAAEEFLASRNLAGTVRVETLPPALLLDLWRSVRARGAPH